jgi:hypothetical protein
MSFRNIIFKHGPPDLGIHQQQKLVISKRLGITNTQVKIWFQNRRRKGIMAKKGTLSKSQLTVLNIELMQVPKRIADEIIEEVRHLDGPPQPMPHIFKDGIPENVKPILDIKPAKHEAEVEPQTTERQPNVQELDGEGPPQVRKTKTAPASAPISTQPARYHPYNVPPLNNTSRYSFPTTASPLYSALSPLGIPSLSPHLFLPPAPPYSAYPYSPARLAFDKHFLAYLNTIKHLSCLSYERYHHLLKNLPNCNGSITGKCHGEVDHVKRLYY